MMPRLIARWMVLLAIPVALAAVPKVYMAGVAYRSTRRCAELFEAMAEEGLIGRGAPARGRNLKAVYLVNVGPYLRQEAPMVDFTTFLIIAPLLVVLFGVG